MNGDRAARAYVGAIEEVMDGISSIGRPEQVVGGALVLLVLLDLILTVLYARAGVGILSTHLAHLTWRAFRLLSGVAGKHRETVLSFCGPAILVLVVLVWAGLMTLGSGLILHPVLGTAVTTSSGATPTDFISALYAGGSSLSIVGASDFSPQTRTYQLVYLFNSLAGLSVLSLTLTYLMQILTALHDRNALGLKMHLLTGATGDAAELIAGIGPQGRFSDGVGVITELASHMSEVKEAHHFYPVLYYFRFREPYYSVPRSALLALDTVTLIDCALDEREYGWLKALASMTHLSRAAMMLVTTLEQTFLPDGPPSPDREPDGEPDEATRDRWRRRYAVGAQRLQQAGITVAADEGAAQETYIGSRSQWDRHIATLAEAMAFDAADIDPAGTNPDIMKQRPPGHARHARFHD